MSHTICHTVVTFSPCLRLPGSHCQNSSQSLMLHRQTLLHCDADAVIQQIRIRTVGRPPVMIDQWHRSWIVQCAVLVHCLAGGPTRLQQCCISMATLHQQQFLANVNSHSRWLYVSPVRLSSVCLSSVTFMCPTQAVQIFRNISTALGILAIHWHPLKIHGDCPLGTPPPGELNTRGSQV